MLDKLKEITIGIVIIIIIIFFKTFCLVWGKKEKAKSKQVVWVWNTSSWQ